MVTCHIVDDDVECLHVGRNPTMTCSGSHLYKFYRYVERCFSITIVCLKHAVLCTIVRASPAGVSIWASKQAFILHTPPNPPSHPLFLEALQIPLQTRAPQFFLFFSFLLIPSSRLLRGRTSARPAAMPVRRRRSQQRGRRRKGARQALTVVERLSEQLNLRRTTARVSRGRETADAASFSPPVPATPDGWSSRRRAPDWAPLRGPHGLSSHVDRPPGVVVRGRRWGCRGCARRRSAGAAARVVLRRRVDGAGGLVYTASIAGTDMVAGIRGD
jgi:hypothetical protein